MTAAPNINVFYISQVCLTINCKAIHLLSDQENTSFQITKSNRHTTTKKNLRVL